MRALGRVGRRAVKLYFTGGATAVLYGWRATTIDVDVLLRPEDDEILRAIPALKESLEINVELACPADFIPELPGWEGRSPFLDQRGNLTFQHYDLYAQALAKIERGHCQDVEDVDQMLRRGLIERGELLRLFGEIEPWLHRYPSIDPPTFRHAVERVVQEPT